VKIDRLQALLLSRNEREMAIVAPTPPGAVETDPFTVFMAYDDDSADYRIADDNSNVLVDMTDAVENN